MDPHCAFVVIALYPTFLSFSLAYVAIARQPFLPYPPFRGQHLLYVLSYSPRVQKLQFPGISPPTSFPPLYLRFWGSGRIDKLVMYVMWWCVYVVHMVFCSFARLGSGRR